MTGDSCRHRILRGFVNGKKSVMLFDSHRVLRKSVFFAGGHRFLRETGDGGGRRVWGSYAPRRKYVSPAGSTSTKRNLLRVTPTVLLRLRVVPVVRLLHAARTRRILLLCVGYTHRIVASCRWYPPHSAAQLQPTPAASYYH